MTTTPNDAAPADEPGRALYEQQIDARTQRWEDVPDAIRAYWNGKATPSRAAGTEAVQAERTFPRVVLELPDGDEREAKVRWTRWEGEDLHVCISVDAPPSVAVAQEAVAWQERAKNPSSPHFGVWRECYVEDAEDRALLTASYDFRPLYLTPAHPEAAKELDRGTEKPYNPLYNLTLMGGKSTE
jgi:hypothetical protein